MAYTTTEDAFETYIEYASLYYGNTQMNRFDEIQADIDILEEEYRREANKLAIMMTNHVMQQKNNYVRQQKIQLKNDAAKFDSTLRQIESDRKAILSSS